MKTLLITAVALAVAFPAFAGSPRVKNQNVAVSGSASQSNANNRGVNNNTTFQDRRQAPGIGAAGECYVGLTGPGFGAVGGWQCKARKDRMEYETARQAFGSRAGRAILCARNPYRVLRECGGNR